MKKGKLQPPYVCDIAKFFDKVSGKKTNLEEASGVRQEISTASLEPDTVEAFHQRRNDDASSGPFKTQADSECELETKESHEYLLSQDEDAITVSWKEPNDGESRHLPIRRKSKDCAELKGLFHRAARRNTSTHLLSKGRKSVEELECLLSVKDKSVGNCTGVRDSQQNKQGSVASWDGKDRKHTGLRASIGSGQDNNTTEKSSGKKREKILQLLERVEVVVKRNKRELETSPEQGTELLQEVAAEHEDSLKHSGAPEQPNENNSDPLKNSCVLALGKSASSTHETCKPSLGCETHLEFSPQIEILHDAQIPLQRQNDQLFDAELDYDLLDFEEEAASDHRFQVVGVEDVHKNAPRKLLRLSNSIGDTCLVYLQDGWYSTPISTGDTVHVFSDSWTFEEVDGGIYKCCTLTFTSGYLILHPDIITSITRLSTMFDCPRKAVLDERLGGGPSNKWAVLGTLIHELFQSYITMPREQTEDELSALAQGIVSCSLEKLCEIQSDEYEMKSLVAEAIPAIRKWRSLFIRPASSDICNFPGCRVDVGQEYGQRLVVEDVVDIEDNIWSVKLGLKGQIDATLRVRNHGRELHAGTPAEELMPLELKTGKPFLAHRAQVVLYTVLLSERYKEEVTSGLLFYSRTGETTGVPKLPMEVSSILQARNELVQWLKQTGAAIQIPPLLESNHQCKRCPQLKNCMLFHKIHENGTPESSGMPSIFEETAAHLTIKQVEFFKKWEHLIELEKQVGLSRLAEIWSMEGCKREELGRCAAGMKIVDASQGAVLMYDLKKRSQIRQTFPCTPSKKENLTIHFQCEEMKTSKDNIVGAEIAEGDRVILSIENEHVALARGHVIQADSGSILVSLMRPLRIPPKMQGNQLLSAEAVMKMPIWRIDRDEVVSTMERLKGALIRLVSQSDAHSRKLCRLIVDLQPPKQQESLVQWETVETAGNCLQADKQDVGMSSIEGLATINHDQQVVTRRAIEKNDYLLVLGMPGTGKTTTISSCIKSLVHKKQSVLVTAYTNAALDHLLQKLVQDGIRVLRLGRTEAVHKNIREWVLGQERFPVKSSACIMSHVRQAQVVGCTSLGAGSPLLSQRGLFDVAIVDEASQITLPASLPPILAAKRFILVGDHNQLPPLVSSSEARERGMEVSLFKMLCEAHPQAVVPLRKQFRMCEDIQLLCNHLVYNGELKCASEAVAKSRICCSSEQMHEAAKGMIRSFFEGSYCHHDDVEREAAWLFSAVNMENPVIFLDTDKAAPRSYEVRKGDSLSNSYEAQLVELLVKTLLTGGLASRDIMVVSPFRSQAEALIRRTKGLDVDILTVDKCQGQDRSCVIVSFTRSNKDHLPGKLLDDIRRLNVAITRAKSKLLLIGSVSTLGSLPVFKKTFEIIQEKGWMVSVGLHPSSLEFPLQ